MLTRLQVNFVVAASLTAAAPACVGPMAAVRPRAAYEAQWNAAVPGVGSNLQLAPAALFQDGTGTTSYHAPTFSDLPSRVEVRDVQGRACESGLQVPWGLLVMASNPLTRPIFASIGWGDSGYQKALRDAANQVAPDALLYDVRVDLQTINVLSIWRQQCLLVTASAVTRLPDEFVPPPAARAAGDAPANADGVDAADAASDAKAPPVTAPAAPQPTAPAKDAAPVAPSAATKAKAQTKAQLEAKAKKVKLGARTTRDKLQELGVATSPVVPPISAPSTVVPVKQAPPEQKTR